jgi:hypothetical protein
VLPNSELQRIRLTGPSIAKLLDKMNTFACTPFIEEGCLALQQKAEYRTDKDLYHVIRLQKIIENIDQIAQVANRDDDEAHASYLRVRAELEQFRAYLISDVSDSRKNLQTLFSDAS